MTSPMDGERAFRPGLMRGTSGGGFKKAQSLYMPDKQGHPAAVTNGVTNRALPTPPVNPPRRTSSISGGSNRDRASSEPVSPLTTSGPTILFPTVTPATGSATNMPYSPSGNGTGHMQYYSSQEASPSYRKMSGPHNIPRSVAVVTPNIAGPLDRDGYTCLDYPEADEDDGAAPKPPARRDSQRFASASPSSENLAAPPAVPKKKSTGGSMKVRELRITAILLRYSWECLMLFETT